MSKFYLSICKHVLPLWSLELLSKLRSRLFYASAWDKISRCQKKNPKFSQTYRRELNYIAAHKEIDLFNDTWKNQYHARSIKVYTDKKKKMHYVLVDGKKPLYYPRSYTKSWIRYAHNALLKEAAPQSPHCYFDTGFHPSREDVLLDIGAAEGIVSLQNIDKVKKAILFEAQEEWMDALRATFAPYKKKVSIVNKFVSDTNAEDRISLDTYSKDFLDENDSFFVKCDIEGNEMSFLHGASDFLRSAKSLKLAICTYHKMSDEADIKAYFAQMDGSRFHIKMSDHSMIYPPYQSKESRPPYFRKGVMKLYKIH